MKNTKNDSKNYKNYKNPYNKPSKDLFTKEMFEEWKYVSKIPKERYMNIQTEFDKKYESIIFKIRLDDLNEDNYISFILFGNGTYHIKFLNDKKFIKISEINIIFEKVNKLISEINKQNKLFIDLINTKKII